MNAKKNTIMNPSDFYSKKKYKIKLSKYKTEDASLNQKLDDLLILMVSIAQNAFRLMY